MNCPLCDDPRARPSWLGSTTYRGRELIAPVWIAPGHADDAMTVHLGYGRTNAGRVGNGAGFNAYRLRHSEAPWFDTGLRAELAPGHYVLACTQMHHRMEGRRPVRHNTLEEFKKEPNFAKELVTEPTLLLVDEPSAGLAPRIVEQVYARLLEVRGQGVTILLVDQNINKAVQVSDYLYLLERGQVRREGPRRDFADQLREIVRDALLGA